MGPDDLYKLQAAFAIVGAGIGFFVGKHVRDHFQLEDAPSLLSLVGAVLFFFASFYLFLFLIAAAVFGLCRLAWRSRAVCMPLIGLLQRLARSARPSTSVAEQLRKEQDAFDARTEAVLTQPYPPATKRSFLEQLEVQHKNRIRGLLDGDDSLSGH